MVINMHSKQSFFKRFQGQVTKVNGIDIWYETFGIKKNKPLLLIMGGCCQGVLWHKEFCDSLASEGFYVIRYDHRDTGLSSCFDFKKKPYDLMDMAKDAVSLLDAIGVEKAHVFGVSLGAFIAEIMAGFFSHRVNSILLLGSSCEIRPMNLAYAGKSQEESAIFSPPKQKYLNWMREFMKEPPQTFEEKVCQRIEGWNQLNGYEYPLDGKINREIQEEFLTRLRNPKVILNHIFVLNNLKSEMLIRYIPSKIKTPAVILHGSEDPIFPYDHGLALSQKIQNSEYIFIEGMGHIPSDHFYDLYIKVLKEQAFKS